jgi:hypothetical protein
MPSTSILPGWISIPNRSNQPTRKPEAPAKQAAFSAPQISSDINS